jgi:hypothetical protein
MAEEQKPYNAGDARDVQKRTKGKKLREEQKEAALRQFLANPAGRMWMWDLLKQCDALPPVMPIAGGSDGIAMALNTHLRLGKYSIGVHLMGEINRVGPEYLMRMSVESQMEESEWLRVVMGETEWSNAVENQENHADV